MIKKNCLVFSSLAIALAHEQNNSVVKGDASTIGLDNLQIQINTLGGSRSRKGKFEVCRKHQDAEQGSYIVKLQEQVTSG